MPLINISKHQAMVTAFWHTETHYRAYSTFALSQWETALLCSDFSHWLAATLKSALHYILVTEVQLYVGSHWASFRLGHGQVITCMISYEIKEYAAIMFYHMKTSKCSYQYWLYPHGNSCSRCTVSVTLRIYQLVRRLYQTDTRNILVISSYIKYHTFDDAERGITWHVQTCQLLKIVWCSTFAAARNGMIFASPCRIFHATRPLFIKKVFFFFKS